jgi:hypothetical protein
MLDSNALPRVCLLGALLALGCDDGSKAPERKPTTVDEDDDGDDDDDGVSGTKRDAGTGGGGKRDASGSGGSCKPSPDCVEVPFMYGVTLEPCCSESFACGFEVNAAPQFRETLATALNLGEDETCIERDRFFLTHPGTDDLRTVTEDGEEIILALECDTASFLSFNFPGCCMPNGRCGVSTYGLWDTIAVFDPEAGFAKQECVSAKELNEQIGDSKLRGLRYLPNTDKACDFEGLDERLGPAEPF